MNDNDITWAAYARLSRLKSNHKSRGRRRREDESVDRQVTLIRNHAKLHGLNLPEHLIFIDNGRSGWINPWDKNAPPPVRPDWDRMVKIGHAGEFGGILTWKIDRFARNVPDGEDLIRLGVLLDGPDSGRIDLRTAHGISVFRKQIEAAAHLSNETHEKVLNAFRDMRAAGYRVGGGRTFGFQVLSESDLSGYDWDSDHGELIGPAVWINEKEAAVVREIARRLLAGETLQSLCDWLNGEKIRTTREKQWVPRALSTMLSNPIYGGWLTCRGERTIRLANAEAILDEKTFDRVQAKLSARRRGRKASGLWPLSGIALCGNPDCERHKATGGQSAMAGISRGDGPPETRQRWYICARDGRVRGCGQSVVAGPAEEMVAVRAVAALADQAQRERVRAADRALDERRAELEQILAETDDDMAEIAAKRSRTRPGQIRLRAQYDENLATLETAYEAAERELGELRPGQMSAEPLPVLTLDQWMKDTPASEQAEFIRRLGLRIVIMPKTRKQGVSRGPFDEDRVQISGGE